VNDVWWDIKLVDIKVGSTSCVDSGLRMAVFSRKAIESGTKIAKIPKAACIHAESDHLLGTALHSADISGHLALIISLGHQMVLGENSKWENYIKSMPDFENIPKFWTSDELKYLEATELKGKTEKGLKFMQLDFDKYVRPLIDSNVLSDRFSFTVFKNAASLVSSRSFGVYISEDVGDAMVPMADIFNHKASVLKLGGEYMLGDQEESDSDSVSPLCGMDSANGIGLKLHIGIIDDDAGNLDIVVVSDIEKDCEIFNTYGELGNADLVHKYGFCLPENPFTAVSLDKSIFFDVVRTVLGDRVFTERFSILKDETALSVLDEEPFELYSNQHIGAPLYVALILFFESLETFYDILSGDEAPEQDIPISKLNEQMTSTLDTMCRKRLSLYGNIPTGEKYETASTLMRSEINILKGFLLVV